MLQVLVRCNQYEDERNSLLVLCCNGLNVNAYCGLDPQRQTTERGVNGGEERMPGGRLTYSDREAIAAGLEEGFSHAEVARRLSRPTSTISREVNRNGGAGGYRADEAQQATERRASRHRPSRPAAPGPPEMSAGDGARDPRAVRGFQEWFTSVLVQMGLTRMTASVLTCLFTTDAGWLTAADLVRRLRVSPASISKAIGYLESQGLVRRERDGGRRERYLVDNDVWLRAWQVSVHTNAVVAEAARSGAEILGPSTPAGARLAVMSRFLRYLGEDMERSAEHWWQLASASGPPSPDNPDQRPR